MKNVIFYLGLFVSALVSFTTTAEQETQRFSDAELAQMLAPIALYPDSLLTHILIASTYPIEIVEAHRWLKKNDNANTEQKSQLLEAFDWDASVQALIPFERVLSRLSGDLSWTQALGDAFLQDESRLLLSIQTLRKQAKLAGSLRKMDNMDVRYEDNNILILPRQKEVVYVPYYDSRMVYGSWFWAAYPPVYWHSNHRVQLSHYRPFHWNTGVHITFNYFFSAFHWHNRHVVVVTPDRARYRYYNQRPRRLIANGGYAKRWSHQPSHRKGVAYRTKRTSEKYYSNRAGENRTNKQFNSSHRNFKQRLHTANNSSHKVKHQVKQKAKHKVKHNVRHNKIKSQQRDKRLASQQKPRSTSEKTRKKQPNSSKRHTSSVRKQHQHKVNRAVNHKSASTRRHHASNTKERK
ncbi:MAG: hypothetical protein ACI936_003589 [Paraglaciecola sp.]|jgi:hypothetical protein